MMAVASPAMKLVGIEAMSAVDRGVMELLPSREKAFDLSQISSTRVLRKVSGSRNAKGNTFKFRASQHICRQGIELAVPVAARRQIWNRRLPSAGSAV